jgi:hypothetical protein
MSVNIFRIVYLIVNKEYFVMKGIVRGLSSLTEKMRVQDNSPQTDLECVSTLYTVNISRNSTEENICEARAFRKFNKIMLQ